MNEDITCRNTAGQVECRVLKVVPHDGHYLLYTDRRVWPVGVDEFVSGDRQKRCLKK